MAEDTKAPEAPVDAVTLEQAAKEYYSVMRGEFEVEQSELQTLKDNARKRMEQLVALAVENAVNLMVNADSDAVRWNVTKYVLDNCLLDKDTPEDELDKIISNLTKKKQPAPSTAE